MRRGPGERRQLFHPCTWHRQGAVAGQLRAPVFILRLHGALDQQAAESRAVDEQVALDAASVAQPQADNEPGLRMKVHAIDHGLDALDAALHGVLAQIGSVKTGVKVEAV